MGPANEKTCLSLTLLILPLLLAFLTCTASLSAQEAPGAFKPIGDMSAPRGGHTATFLANGKVLIAGGTLGSAAGDGLTRAELFDPATATFSATGEMVTARRGHTATLLTDGRVLIAGGFLGSSNTLLASAELYDPATGTFTATGSMLTARGLHTATLLYDGTVLVAGGDYTAELYDPATGTFAATGAYAGIDAGTPFVDTATLLPDGKVLITGCDCSRSVAVPVTELYDPRAGSFSLTNTMGGETTVNWWYNVNTASLLRNGKILVVGSDEYDDPADAEVYDPMTGIISRIGNTSLPHEFSTATLLRDGTVLIAGSQLPGGSGAAGAELYDPVTGKFSAAGNMTTGRHSHTATLLPDGTVLIAGGFRGWPAPSSSAELYVPNLLKPALIVTDLRFDLAVVPAGASYAVNIAGAALTAETFFDVRFTSPGSVRSAVVLNWQKGMVESHDVPLGLAAGKWTINGVRPHEIETDHTGDFFTVSATITVSP